ncbi:sensor histidine kinase [Pedobacter frigidisoli]|nr:histidine kinase [Pedobacter frigidisoli]
MSKLKRFLSNTTGWIPLLIWVLFLLLPFLYRIIMLPGELHNKIIQNLFFSSVLLIGLFYLHTYLIYPLRDKPYGKWKYFAVIGCCLIVFCLVMRYLIPFGTRVSSVETENYRRAKPPVSTAAIFSFGLAILGSYCYRFYLDKVKQAALISELESIQLKTELDFLRSQINPRFMFNIMNSLVSMARKKSELMEPSLISLSQLMRYTLYNSEGSRIGLDKEVEYLKNYINLQLIRFSDELQFNLFLSGHFEGYKIEPMLMMPFVENAFKHGIGTVKPPLIDVSLSMDTTNQLLSLVVINSLADRKVPQNEGSGIGLVNVTRRLELLYPDRHSLKVHQQGDVFIAKLDLNL